MHTAHMNDLRSSKRFNVLVGGRLELPLLPHSMAVSFCNSWNRIHDREDELAIIVPAQTVKIRVRRDIKLV